MEFIKGISLREYYNSFKERKIDEKSCKKICYQLFGAMDYLHSNHIAHRDIKLENVIIDKEKNVKLIDFGFGMYAPDNALQTFFCGTPNYMPPEIIMKVDYDGIKADLWSLGVLLFKMLSGEFPFKGKDEKELYSQSKKGNYSFPNIISKDARDIIKKLIVLNPEQRISCGELLGYQWFQGEQ